MLKKINKLFEYNHIEFIGLMLSLIVSCICLVISSNYLNAVVHILQVFSLLSVTKLCENPFLDSFTPQIPFMLVLLPTAMAMLTPNIPSMISFMLTSIIAMFIIKNKFKWLYAVFNITFIALITTLALAKNIVFFDPTVNSINWISIALFMISVIVALVSLRMANGSRIIKSSCLILAFWGVLKLVLQGILFPTIFNVPYSTYKSEYYSLFCAAIYIMIKTIITNNNHSVKGIVKSIRRIYFASCINETSFFVQAKLDNFITATITPISLGKIKLYMYYIIEPQTKFICPQEEWHIEDSSFDDAKACVCETILESCDNIADRVIAAIEKLEVANFKEE